MATFPDVDTRDATAVSTRIRKHLREIDPEGDLTLFNQVFDQVHALSHGKLGDYQAIDLEYHDYQHTLQASLCMAEILVGRHRAGAKPAFTWRQSILGMVAILMHDSGYLKTAADGSGSGAKFTYTHVLRSASVAASLIPEHGVNLEEIDTVVNAIRCTGSTADIGKLAFTSETDRLISTCVTTADYLGQMSADDYPDELEIVYRELNESDDYVDVPQSDRMFSSAEDLISKTPGFWEHFVIPKMESDFHGVYHFLSSPYPDGPNPYLHTVERNIKIIRERIATLAPEAEGS